MKASTNELLTKHDDAVVKVSTEHAHAAPRGAVYLELCEDEGDGPDWVQVALTPSQAEAVATALVAQARIARTNPEATIDCFGKPL